LRPTQKHCVQHREVAIDWLECIFGFHFFISLNWVLQNSGHSFTGEGRVLYGEVFEIGEAALAGKAI